LTRYRIGAILKCLRSSSLRELRVQHEGRPYRVLYAFDPARKAVLLLGGDKGGDDRFYEQAIPRAEALWERYLAERSTEREE
jgi:hypothetical protein